ncbi:putative chromatin assembly factor 1 subunit A [Lupinus albus]|uniref:Putative chromatin assembly factor 1 subunit A n=1 Tax=Lupinus albus TaxID=3870 RepID=A0A6A4N6A9_LUPAL|nr:putative chromatin assembly factor 1 subunit A [Lupinus albus]
MADKMINKRKRKNVPENLSSQEKEARIKVLQNELNALFDYYKEVKNEKVEVKLSECGSMNAVIAVLIEESEFPLLMLVDEVHEKMKNAGSGVVPVERMTHASVKSSVLSLGQRVVYGVVNEDADILEDHAESCLWCWETRDVKLIPESVRGRFIVRRIFRGRIHARIMAVSEMITSLKKPESEQNYNNGLLKASAKLGKTYSEAEIRLLVGGILQKNSVDMTMIKAKREEKLLLKQLDRNRREVAKENDNLHNELQRETLLSERDLKLLEGEANKDEKCHEKDSCKKMQKKEETEKDQRRREKEESDLKKKRSLQKQVSIMERFLKRGKSTHSFLNNQFSSNSAACDSSIRNSENVCEAATLSMDSTLASSIDITFEDIRKSNFSLWHSLGQSIRSNRKQRWGLRWKPKSELFNELKLASTIGVSHYGDLAMEKHINELGEHSSDISPSQTNADSSHTKKFFPGKQLLQFDNSPRPAFYGIWPKKSQVVGPHHPFRKDPSLDYDVNSDEEWEEEDPGESLSDCDNDEEECLEEHSKSDDESEDGFFVPDGYLSEDEGAQVDKLENDIDIERAKSSPGCKNDVEAEEFCALLQQQKNLNDLTEHALKRKRLWIISNLMHEHDKELDDNSVGTFNLEQMCLQSLSMRIISASSYIEISMDIMQDEDQEDRLSAGKGGAPAISNVHAMLDSNLPLIVATIQNCSQGINKVLESLQDKFPSASSSLLRNKVHEVSDYIDNRLQVKKDVLVKLGLPHYPEKSCVKSRSIATFFQKGDRKNQHMPSNSTLKNSD